jgi:hypothetical protein
VYPQASNTVVPEVVAVADPDLLVRFTPARAVKVGLGKSEVEMSMQGRPDEKLGPDLWLYWNFQPAGQPAADEPKALVIFFSGDRVQSIRLVETKPARALLAQLRLKQAKSNTVPARR